MFTWYRARQICAGTFLLLFGMVAGKSQLLGSDNQQTQQQKMAMTIRSEMRAALDTEFACWYPRSIDTVYGGFLSDFNYMWLPQGVQNKMIVTQARHVWSATNAAMFYQKDTTFRAIAAHGIRFLQTKMWDNEFGGFYDLVTREGNPILENGRIIKRAYGHAFV
ncbi:MAG: AGE family epimerase/isomerase, partial [Bacteroidetes bacterium]|nr:AGE family epimerase/isomerase [Bacteroidota bacterium]